MALDNCWLARTGWYISTIGGSEAVGAETRANFRASGFSSVCCLFLPAAEDNVYCLVTYRKLGIQK